MLRVLTLCGDPIVTVKAGAYDRIMIHSNNRDPADRPMAIFTVIGRQDMSRNFCIGGNTIVTVDTGIANIAVIENRV